MPDSPLEAVGTTATSLKDIETSPPAPEEDPSSALTAPPAPDPSESHSAGATAPPCSPASDRPARPAGKNAPSCAETAPERSERSCRSSGFEPCCSSTLCSRFRAPSKPRVRFSAPRLAGPCCNAEPTPAPLLGCTAILPGAECLEGSGGAADGLGKADRGSGARGWALPVAAPSARPLLRCAAARADAVLSAADRISRRYFSSTAVMPLMSLLSPLS
mmetsp:Transcript_609/g.1460  ORF Transcript_609/g.1460 Transcript_609/m.1460 type:complete len:218 (-) Transcript_609:2480-3133(-)